MSFDPLWEDRIYSKGHQVNRYPFGELVSYVLGLHGRDLRSGERKLRALELGSGAGNNLAFLAKEGFETYGIEGSKSACAHAETFLKNQGLVASISRGDFAQLPYDRDFFDLIIDREAVYANRMETIVRVAAEVRRCLKPGGRFLSFAYSDEHGSIRHDGGREIEPGTYVDFTSGSFQNTGAAHFFTESEIRERYFEGLKIEFLYHHRTDTIFPGVRNHFAEFIVCGRKPG